MISNLSYAEIHSVKLEKRDKADVLLDPAWLPENKRALFIDDDLNEHIDERVLRSSRITKMLFTRGIAR